MGNYKKVTNSKDQSLKGDIIFYDKKIFDQLINNIIKLKDLKSDQYVEFKKNYNSEKLIETYGRSDLNEIFIRKKNTKISELFISTTNVTITKEKEITYTNADLLELEKKKLIFINRDKISQKVKSIATNYNISVEELFKKIDDPYSYEGADIFETQTTEEKLERQKKYLKLIGGKKKYIDDIIYKKIGPKIKILYFPLNEDNFEEVLEKVSEKEEINCIISNHHDMPNLSNEDSFNTNGIIDITSGDLIISNSAFDSILLQVPIGKYKVYEKYDATYDKNIQEEINLIEYENEMERLLKKYNNDVEEAEKHGFDEEYWYQRKEFGPEEPNIHFLYIDFSKSF